MTIIGERFGRLLVVSRNEAKSTPGRTWVTVRCDCGTIKPARLDGLRAGAIVSCGCKKKEHNLKHGHRRLGSSDRTYISWDSMWQRCTNPSSPRYAAYGGRGITVDPRWADFRAFLADMGERPDERDLDRKDNNLGYCKDNCRWATRREQLLNTRRTVMVEYEGATHSLSQLSAEAGLGQALVYARVKKLGWSVERALTTPNQRSN